MGLNAARIARAMRASVAPLATAALACSDPGPQAGARPAPVAPGAPSLEPAVTSAALAGGTGTAAFTATGGAVDASGLYRSATTQGNYQVSVNVATTAGSQLTATSNVAVTPPASATSGGAYPNQPSGFVPIAEFSAAGLLPDQQATCGGYGIVAGCWYRFSSNLSLTTDASAPKSPGSVLQYVWPAGLPVGSSAGMLGGWSAASGGEGGQDQYSQIYESGWIRLVGTTFEAPDAGMKLLGYWGVGQGNDSTRVANQVYSMISGGTRSAFTLDIRQQGPVSRSMMQNVNGGALLVVGQWIRYEILMKLNTIGVANGTLKVWLNGQLTHSYSDVTWRTSSAPTGFYGRRWDPIWGGAGTPPAKTRTDRMLIDHIYISALR